MKLIRNCLKWLLVLILLAAVGVCAVFGTEGYRMYKAAVLEVPIDEKVQNIESRDGYLKYEDLPQIYIDAVISVEDRRFWDHGGVDPFAVGRAILNDIRTLSAAEGGSTITQQLAKNLYFTQEQSLRRKLAEIFVARDLERHFSKDQILEAYINCIYYGDGYYSIHDASVGYFGVVPIQMSNDQATLLAGVPNAPSRYAPSTNMALARQRQQHVLSAMVAEGYLTEEEALAIPQGY